MEIEELVENSNTIIHLYKNKLVVSKDPRNKIGITDDPKIIVELMLRIFKYVFTTNNKTFDDLLYYDVEKSLLKTIEINNVKFKGN